MILVKKNRLIVILGFLLLFCLPFLSSLFSTDPAYLANVQIERAPLMVPLVVLVEVVIYIIFAFLSGAFSSGSSLILNCLLMAFIRFLFCLGGGIFFSFFHEASEYSYILLFWVGNPILILLQMFILMILTPHVALSMDSPMLSEEARSLLGEEEEYREVERPRVVHKEGIPVGGFVRVYDFRELGRLISNVIGLEGYLLYTWEGLILWEDNQLGFDSEKCAVLFQAEWKAQQAIQAKMGFNNPDHMITLTRDHQFVHIAFSEKFFAVLLFRRDADTGTILNRMRFLERTAKELFEMRYSPLL